MQFDVRGKTPLAEGGEGIIYKYGNSSVVKIYKPHINMKSKQLKIQMLIKTNLPAEAIKPTDIVTDRKGNFIGMVMPKVDGEDFKRLSNKKFVTSNNINTKDILEMLTRFWQVLQELHKYSIYIGDLNDQNILFDKKTKKIFLIDTDSWTIGNERCEVAMDLFKDPNLVKDNFNAATDTYAFCVLAWKTLTRVHPFGGTTNPDMQIMDRINKGLSVIDNPNVKIPKTTKSWRNLSPDLVQAFKQVFNNGDRKFGNYLEDMLNNLTFCKNDNDYYFGEFSSCPMCNAAATVVKKAISVGVENEFKIAKMLSGDNIRVVYSMREYLDADNFVVDTKTGKKVAYNGGRCLFDDKGNSVLCFDDVMMIVVGNDITTIPIQYNSYPMVEGNSIYYISDQGCLCKSEVVGTGISRKIIQKCSTNAFFKVSNGKCCVVNIYDGKIIVNIDGYFYEMDFDKKIIAGDAHYDARTDRWLIVLEDTTSTYHSYILDKNTLVWQSSKVDYKCPVYNICFDSGAIYIPIDDAIRGMNIKTLQYKDFTCSVVDSNSVLIKNGGQFIIVNDDNVYRFYK